MDNQQKQESAYKRYIDCKLLISAQSCLFVELGLLLKDIKDNKLYTYIGDGGFETWGRFLSQPEINIPYSTAHCYIRIIDVYRDMIGIDVEELQKRPFSKLQRLLPFVSKIEYDEAKILYYAVIELGARDFADEIKKLKGEPIKRKPTVSECITCGNWKLSVEESDLCQCQKYKEE